MATACVLCKSEVPPVPSELIEEKLECECGLLYNSDCTPYRSDEYTGYIRAGDSDDDACSTCGYIDCECCGDCGSYPCECDKCDVCEDKAGYCDCCTTCMSTECECCTSCYKAPDDCECCSTCNATSPDNCTCCGECGKSADDCTCNDEDEDDGDED